MTKTLLTSLTIIAAVFVLMLLLGLKMMILNKLTERRNNENKTKTNYRR